MRIVERIFQITVFVVAGFMAWGGGFFWRELLADNVIRTNTYTLYRTLPPPPRSALLSAGRHRQIWPGAAVQFRAALCLVAAARRSY